MCSSDLKDRALELVVSDDGEGFDVTRARDRARRGLSFGLLGMEERASLVGGVVSLTSAVGRGTEVRASIPLDGTAGEEAA